MPELPFQIITISVDIFIIIFIVLYYIRLHNKEKALEEKENKIDSDYHRVVDDALNKERKILDDATSEADKIISDTKYATKASKESIDEALQKMAAELQSSTQQTTHAFLTYFHNSLSQISYKQLVEFQNTIKKFEEDLSRQSEDFRKSLLPKMEQQLEEYKQKRIKESEKSINQIVQKASQEVMNRSISTEDHQKLVLDALEKAKKEGIFD
jgi:F0F1-type ATP synthase membrane subunit b/b'